MERTPFRDSEIFKLHEIVIRLDGYAQARLLPPLGITYPEFLVLMAVEETARATHGDVAAMLEMSKSLVSQRVSALEKKGLLRQVVNTANKESITLSSAQKGEPWFPGPSMPCSRPRTEYLQRSAAGGRG